MKTALCFNNNVDQGVKFQDKKSTMALTTNALTNKAFIDSNLQSLSNIS